MVLPYPNSVQVFGMEQPNAAVPDTRTVLNKQIGHACSSRSRFVLLCKSSCLHQIVWLTVGVNKVVNKPLYDPGVVVFIRLKGINPK